MGTIALQIPQLGQSDATEEAKIVSDLNTLQTLLNGNLDAANVADGSLTATELALAVKQWAGLTDNTAVRRGHTNIATQETVTSTTYATAPTPDQVLNVVLPADGLLLVAFQGMWMGSNPTQARAALFLNSTQLQYADTTSAAPVVQEASISGNTANKYDVLTCGANGMYSFGGSLTPYPGDATTGQLVGINQDKGGFAVIFAAAGTYTVGVRYKSMTSGSVTVKNRRLWVWTAGF